MQGSLPDLSLEDTILGLLNPESISQAETALETYFTKPNALDLIEPLLLSSDLRIRQSALVLLPRVTEYSQADSRPLPTTLSSTLWEVFFLIDDPSCLSTTWTVIAPILRDINPDSFIGSVFEHFPICCQHNKVCHAIILACRLLSTCQTQIPIDFATTIHPIAMMTIDASSLIADDFGRLYIIGKTLRIHLFLIQSSHLAFDLPLGHQYLQLFSTIQFQNVHNTHVLFKCWRLLFEMVVSCIPSIEECHADYTQFVDNLLAFIISISENQALVLERRWDPLLGFAAIWRSYSHSSTTQLFCITLLKQEILLSLDTTARDQSFNQTPITNLIGKCSHVLESTDLVALVFNLLMQLRKQISLADISTVCLYYGDLLRVSQEIPVEGMSIIINDLHVFSDELRRAFSPLNAQGIIYLIESLPANICSEHSDYLVNLLLQLTQSPDSEVQERAILVLCHSIERFQPQQIIELWELRTQFAESGWILQPILIGLQQSEALPPDFVEQVMADVYIYLQSGDHRFLSSALKIIVWYFSCHLDCIAEHLESIVRILSEWLTALVEDQVIAILVFLIEIERLSPYVDGIMRSLVTPTVLACRMLNLESFIERPEKMARLMRFLTPDMMILMVRHYTEQIDADPVRYFLLIGRLADHCNAKTIE
jgi:hypothetical protein